MHNSEEDFLSTLWGGPSHEIAGELAVDRRRVKTWHRFGVWAVHRFFVEGDPEPWAVDHVSSGAMAASCATEEMARDLAMQLSVRFPNWRADAEFGKLHPDKHVFQVRVFIGYWLGSTK